MSPPVHLLAEAAARISTADKEDITAAGRSTSDEELDGGVSNAENEKEQVKRLWARRMDDGFLQELGNTVFCVSYGAKGGRKGNIDRFITSIRTSATMW